MGSPKLEWLVVASENESVVITSNNVTILKRMMINGERYATPGEYTVANWNSRPTPTNITGTGMIRILPGGTVLSIR